MIDVDIPGFGRFALKHLVLDYNGTIAVGGNLLPGVLEVLEQLAPVLEFHVVTADTFGSARQNLAGMPVNVVVLPEGGQAEEKADYVRGLGAESVVAVGNGRNDRKMLEAAAIGIFVVQREGGAVRTLAKADVISTNVLEALELLLYPKRLVATLRS